MVSNDGTTYTGKDPRAKIIVQPLGRPLAKPHKSTKKMYKIFKRFQKWSVTAINAISLIIPYAVIGGFSKFKRGRSTRRQQVFMVGWLVVGQFIGALNIASLSAPRKGRKRHRWELVEWVLTKLVISVGVAFAIGGFVESGKMMKEFGYCIKIPGEGSSLSTS